MNSAVRTRPVIAFDGTESLQGRAMLLISALRFCADWLPCVEARMIDVENEDVLLALQVLQWEYGLSLNTERPEADSPLKNADLYAGIAYKSGSHFRLTEAAELAIPAFIAIQFPEPAWLSESVLFRTSAAFDPRVFASELRSIVAPWL